MCLAEGQLLLAEPTLNIENSPIYQEGTQRITTFTEEARNQNPGKLE
jgi:hypothetical protein